MINTAIYAGQSKTVVFVEPDNKFIQADNHELTAWVAQGNIIGDYVEPMGDNKTVKYAEIFAQADLIINNKEAGFYATGLSVNRNKERLLRAQNRRNNKKIAGTLLTVNEQELDDQYDVFMDWADQVYDAADLAVDVVELLNTVTEVKNYNAVTNPNWPTFPV